ncbi:enoyl-[acyl-carrier protein] reductase I [Deinobacterium chartae]|uniref:Enoyl-[acyl-carrier-protein] reductase [NADH] n=1 Tax=Deinobacterium chartae TaxID=521158 RepID=A0A841I1G7_9DEIO|nr:enoyl-ACP reductase [Deinobacterium chartae]MBB6098916.1 enoyl-[acyl-carrier protein] reductase I [Deinobacterium chartae]
MISIDLTGKNALILGVTNARSLGWAIAQQLLAAGARCAFSYQGERLRPDIEKLTAEHPGSLLEQCDVTAEADLERLFGRIEQEMGRLDYVVHAVAFAPRAAMEGRFVDTTSEDWNTALNVSAYSLVAIARHAEPLMAEGGSIVTLTYYASQKVVPKYNVMGIAKAALEASTRYLAYELGSKNIRVNAISAGPMRTVAARSIPGFGTMYDKSAKAAALGRNATQEEVGKLGLFLLSDLASGITGEVTYVDAGYNIMGMKLED